jgi:biopolymer transport protein ExbB
MNAFKSFVIDEWYFSIPMFLMSLVAATLVIWRFLLNMNAKTRMEEFLPVFQDTLTYDGVQRSIEYCRAQDGMIPKKLYVAGLEASPQGNAAMKRSMASVMELEILPSLNFLLAPILAIAKIATMVGLLGTVISMISTFSSIAEAKNDPTKVTSSAGAIGLALFATAFGLMTAIPLVFMHVMFKDFNSRQEHAMKAAAQRMIVLFNNIKPKWDEGVQERPLDDLPPGDDPGRYDDPRRYDDYDRDRDPPRDYDDRIGDILDDRQDQRGSRR